MNIWSTDGGIYMGYEVKEPSEFINKMQMSCKWILTNSINLYSGSGHVITFGPSGIGKTRKVLLPNLIHMYLWSMVVIDPKGELAVWTAKHRAEYGSEILIFDPFGEIERRNPGLVEKLPFLKSKGFNPMSMLDPDSVNFPDEAKAIAEALITVDEKDVHWGNSARTLVTGLIMVLRMTLEKDDPKNSLVGVRQLLGLEPEVLGEYIKNIIADTLGKPAIAAKLNRFTEFNPENRELLSILSCALTQTEWLDSIPIHSSLSCGAFDFSEMKKRPVTVYLILPPNYLIAHSRWLRMMITAVLTPLLRSTTKDQDVPVLFMLDEFAQLGRIEVIEQNMPIMRGYGIKLLIVLQNIPQLKSLYKESYEDFISNAGIIQCFAPQDLTTREYISKLSGTHRMVVYTHSKTESYNPSIGPMKSTSTTDSGVPMIENVYPEDSLAKMNANQSVLIEAHCSPRRTVFPDPSEMSGFEIVPISEFYPKLSLSKILEQADELAAQCNAPAPSVRLLFE